MQDEYSKIFSLFWALMPLSKDELNSIEKGHRIRPYLTFNIDGDIYGFPCSSKVFTKKSRYANSQIILGRGYDRKSIVSLDCVFKMPLENLKGFFRVVTKEEENEIIKRIQANIPFYNYPLTVCSYFESLPYKITWGDMLVQNDALYYVIGKINKSLLLVPIFKYPVNNTISFQVDGLLFFADVDNLLLLQNDNSFKYVTKGSKFIIGKEEKDIEGINDLRNYYNKMPKIKCDCDYSSFYMLSPGMIIDYYDNNIINKMIILSKNEDEYDVIYGSENEIYSNFKHVKLPISTEIQFKITGVLSNERIEKLKSKFILEEKELKLVK